MGPHAVHHRRHAEGQHHPKLLQGLEKEQLRQHGDGTEHLRGGEQEEKYVTAVRSLSCP